jgi:hypothetical protein
LEPRLEPLDGVAPLLGLGWHTVFWLPNKPTSQNASRVDTVSNQSTGGVTKFL